MKFRKGDVVINKKCPWHVVALTEEDTYVKKRKGFPRYSSERDDPYRSAPSYSESIHTFLEKIDKSHHYSRYEVYEIQVAFSLVDSGKHDEFEARKEQTEPHPLTKPSWRFVQEKIEYHRWEAVISIVRQRMIVVSVDHPMMRYATEVVPKLKEPELLVLTRQLPGYKKRTSALAVMKYLQDHLQQQMYAVIDPNVCIGNYQHSCAPNCVFELSATNPENTLELSLVALYDVSDESEITICQIEEHDSVELRENALQRRTGHSCGCLRCRYEACNWISHPPQTNLREAQQLGHFYFSAVNLELAKKMYEMTLEQVPNDPDLWHALGAVYLAERKFVQAQRIWKKAAENYPKECGNHKEIRLQLDKIASYEYFSRSEVPATETSHSWHAVVNQAFVTKEVISRETCQQVIRWAESGEWTTQRHYAVPTHDVPVHTVPKLLDWSKRLFKTSIQPILVIRPVPHFYIHDAFCVKYEGGSFSNHLPIHVDESTHSFVLALNDDYEGGGTYFYDEDTTVHLKTGDLLSFKGDSVYHGGEVLTQGTRYIIAAFLYHDDGNNESAKSDENSCRKRQAGDLQSEFQKTKEQKTSFCFGFKG